MFYVGYDCICRVINVHCDTYILQKQNAVSTYKAIKDEHTQLGAQNKSEDCEKNLLNVPEIKIPQRPGDRHIRD